FVIGLVIERTLIRLFHDRPVLSTVIVFIGLLTLINGLSGAIFNPTQKQFGSPFASQAWYGTTYLSPHEVGMIAVTLIVLACVFAFFRFTRLGLAMRAAAENRPSSRLVGIRVGWMLGLGWGLAALLGSIAGVMAAPTLVLEPQMMASVILYGFAAALLGG